MTEVTAMGTDTVTMYGGPLITLKGHFELSSDTPKLRFQLPGSDMSSEIPATQKHLDSLRFVMQPFILPLEMRTAVVSV